MNGHETVFARDDDSIRFKSRETIVVCSGSVFDKESLWAVRPWMSYETWMGYADMPVESFPLNALVCLAKVYSCRWLDDMCARACLCRPEGKFGITLVEPEAIYPPIPLLPGNKAVEIKIPRVEKSGQHLLF